MDAILIEASDRSELENAIESTCISHEGINETNGKVRISVYGEETNRLMMELRQRNVDYDVRIS